MLRNLYKALRTLLVTLAVAAVALPALLWLGLSLPAVHERLRAEAEKELGRLLGTRVEIGRVTLRPFSEVTLLDVSVADPSGDATAPAPLRAGRLGAGVSLWRSVANGRVVITYVEVVDAHAVLSRPTAGAPLNIQPIIDRLQPREPQSEKPQVELEINNIVVRNSSVAYDVADASPRPGPLPDPNHLRVNELRADLQLPSVGGERLDVRLKRLAFSETRSGLTVDNLRFSLLSGPGYTRLEGFELEMPGTRLALEAAEADAGLKALAADPLHTAMQVRTQGPCRLALPGGLEAGLALDAEGTADAPTVNALELTLGRDATRLLRLEAHGQLSGLARGDAARIEAQGLQARLDADGAALAHAGVPEALGLRPLPAAIVRLAEALGAIELDVSEGAGSRDDARVKARLATSAGTVTLDATALATAGGRLLEGRVNADAINLERLLPQAGPLEQGSFEGMVSALIDPRGRLASAGIDGMVESLWLNGLVLEPLALEGGLEGGDATLRATCHDPRARFDVEARLGLPEKGMSDGSLHARADVERLELWRLGLTPAADSLSVEGGLTATIEGLDPDRACGAVMIEQLRATASGGRLLDLPTATLTASLSEEGERQLSLDSDIAVADVNGRFTIASLQQTALALLHAWQPALFAAPAGDAAAWGDDTIDLSMTIEPDNPLEQFVKLPVGILAPVGVSASLSGPEGQIWLDVDAPWLSNGNNLVEGTRLTASIDADGPAGGDGQATANLLLATAFPAKGGMVSLEARGEGRGEEARLGLQWSNGSGVNRGRVALRSAVRPSQLVEGRFTADIDIDGGEMVFNDTVWALQPARVMLAPGLIEVSPFAITHGEQAVRIGGRASAEYPDEALRVELEKINLDYVFRTLAIEVAMFGGTATGSIAARGLLTPEPVIHTERLRVDNLTYNGCLMGDGDLSSGFDPSTTAVSIGAVIHQRNGRTSVVDGKITPRGELLDFNFDCDRAPVGFLRPFMAAFCDGISGMASGKVHLGGTFADVDMEGDVLAEDLEMAIAITGTSYRTLSDRVTMRPGRIDFEGVTLLDSHGNTATFGGTLRHRYFHDPSFSFRVADAHNFLVYNQRQSDEHPWFGRIYADGSVDIKGEPGRVDISANVAAVDGTEFTFVLSDMEQAAEHSFITWRDATPRAPKAGAATAGVAAAGESSAQARLEEALLRRARKASGADKAPEVPTQYVMTFAVDVTPRARMVLVMDPVGGDRILANGHGDIRLSYDSAGDDLRMYGTYTLERGSYTFTLQDIFLKDFTIEEGSMISFNGDPYTANLDISAHYALTANLTDLDESFAQDRDLTRTSVPVHALMLISGDMRSPDLSFDLAFPTLQSDVYRKVKSIVNTDDMMNRQILYLLALNRFYTPEYMEATKGNELVSVASSTLSSRLGNMLGQLSDKVTVAPTIRSDRGDFSDVEFDLALSSHLLNNRLLLNGTFGYRDAALNSTSFIGDFDAEYLLNRSGSVRLKAYNRFNDQNYYLKSALTTQGVGVVYKRDFDDILSFIKPLLRRRPAAAAETDSVK